MVCAWFRFRRSNTVIFEILTMIFYTYMWLREDGTPYYIGKGSGRRAFRKKSQPIERIIVQEYLSEDDAFEAEAFLIRFYGRKDLGTGVLINLTDGGQGMSGHKTPEEVKLKISKALTGRVAGPCSNDHRQKLSEACKGRLAWNKGHKMPLEFSQKISERQKGRKLSYKCRKKIGSGLRRFLKSHKTHIELTVRQLSNIKYDRRKTRRLTRRQRRNIQSGDIAQSGERLFCTQEAVGAEPTISTKLQRITWRLR